MKGAREYANLLSTGQYGRLYLVSGSHARGRTFHIYVLPEGEEAISNGPNNGPRNKDAVEVYGILSGNPGWTESYGWKHAGPWQDDFASLVEQAKGEQEKRKAEILRREQEAAQKTRNRELALLNTYTKEPTP